jgi:tetratricopeptide (TPR) repeat protein
LLIFLLYKPVQELLRYRKFNQYYKQHEASLQKLPTLMQSGRMGEAVTRFEEAMKEAPDNAYFLYMRAFFLQAAQRYPESISAANKALAMAEKDPMLPSMLKEAKQQAGGQMDLPETVTEFRTKLEELKRALEPRVMQMRARREAAKAKHKKKSR